METKLQDIIHIWQPSAARSLTEGDAREIVINLNGFFQVLAEWDAQDALISPQNQEVLP
ncbi:hypothetical protein D3C72_819450 [compost metagenome]